MPRITEEQLVKNWNELLQIVKDTFPEERASKILKMLEYFEDRMSMCPASAKEHFHNAFPGGLVDHTLGVIKNAKKLLPIWKSADTFVNYTEEETVCAALFHDFGKVGDLNTDYYIPNESEWHRINQGKIYELNPKLNYMSVTDRTFHLLSHFGIEITTNEYLAIRLADGMYAESNKGYLAGYEDAFRLKTNLPHLIHHADMMAMVSEYDAWKHSPDGELTTPQKKKASNEVKKKETLADAFARQSAGGGPAFDPKLFDDLFTDKKPGE